MTDATYFTDDLPAVLVRVLPRGGRRAVAGRGPHLGAGGAAAARGPRRRRSAAGPLDPGRGLVVDLRSVALQAAARAEQEIRAYPRVYSRLLHGAHPQQGGPRPRRPRQGRGARRRCARRSRRHRRGAGPAAGRAARPRWRPGWGWAGEAAAGPAVRAVDLGRARHRPVRAVAGRRPWSPPPGPTTGSRSCSTGATTPTGCCGPATALETFLPARAVHVFDAPWPWQHDPSAAAGDREAEAVRAAAVRSRCAPTPCWSARCSRATTRPCCRSTARRRADRRRALRPHPRRRPRHLPARSRRRAATGAASRSCKRVDLLLAISAYSARAGAQLLGDACPPVAPVWGGPYPSGLFAAFEARAVDAPAARARPLRAGRRRRPPAQEPRPARAGLGPGAADARPARRWSSPAGSTSARCGGCGGSPRRPGLADGELVLTGEVSEDALEALYRGALAFVFPSTEEGLGLPPLEAMARRLPDRPGARRVAVRAGRRAGRLLRRHAVQDMARALVPAC